jgi:hypothetical protein
MYQDTYLESSYVARSMNLESSVTNESKQYANNVDYHQF